MRDVACVKYARMTIVLSMENVEIPPGEAIRALRKKAGLTIEQVAAKAGVSATHLSRVETGSKNATPYWLGAVTEAIAKTLRSDGPAKSAKDLVA